MSRIDFYVLPDSGAAARQRFACRLAEKAYSLKNSVHIRVADRQAADQLDDLLWTFRDGSFVPHEQISTAATDAESPVTIGFGGGDSRDCDLLINLTESVPENTATFPRVAEIVTADAPSRQTSRERFASYRDAGHSLDTHKL